MSDHTLTDEQYELLCYIWWLLDEGDDMEAIRLSMRMAEALGLDTLEKRNRVRSLASSMVQP